MTDIFNGRRGPEVDETWRNLVQCYGMERAIQIVDGKDEKANADIAAWKRLGGLSDATRAAG